METSDKSNMEIVRRDGTYNLEYGSSSVSSDWQLGDANSAIGMFRQNTGFSRFSAQNAAGSSNTMGFENINNGSFRNGIHRPLEMMWNGPSLLPKGKGVLSPGVPVLLSQSLSEFPADLGFIERAARFSCFGDMINHSLGGPELMGLYSQTGRMMRGPEDICGGNVGKSALGEQSPKNGANICEPPRDPFLGEGHGKSENLLRSYDHNKRNIPGSSNVSDEARSSGGNGQDEQPCEEGKALEIPLKVSNTKKRKRVRQDTEPDPSKRPQNSDEAADETTDNDAKEEPNPNPAANQITAGKHGKQNSDLPMEGYIHMRARRGQATNRHSIAERVRREKISERMKFLQDLVPGCNKVTGKAVMLDEIVNYVQSLQRQVEFLSMKLAMVNPGLDFNIEGFLAKEALLHTRPGLSSCVAFPQDISMAYSTLLHPSPPGLVQPVLSGTSNPSNFFPRAMNLAAQFPPVSSGFKQQEKHVWEGYLHNVVQMSYGTGVLTDDQDEIESPVSC